ncbi:hypothetical protein BuS5_00264 [Desulfosarcina sp. BuS5]|uniref:penicillin-binding transpeptidase domain-containing protein n=1 Tax=Desulfosarcina sp. BuS5 TaxID=933262 RepID=UPI0006878754|nr:penicillin-binding transpeptidase domain-containing protein [Desulfosarcina sp. BuS5]WDN87296.1 hypothetical protein BuS5_00264 [Desulfosarcina sp. BuS5]
MKKNIKYRVPAAKIPGWRDYQDNLKKAARRSRFFRIAIKLTAASFCAFLMVYGIISGFAGSDRDHAEAHNNDISKLAAKGARGETSNNDAKEFLQKEEIQSMISGRDFVNIQDKSLKIISNGIELRADTSIDIPLQQFILKKMKRSTSRYIGIVTMDPLTGRILTMAGYDKTDPSGNPCLDNRFPAASIFKIVTAAAAIEKCGFSAQSGFKYNGKKHTLYKLQLKERTNKYTNRITLKNSFAQSVNPVFGKLGAIYIGKNALEEYADSFGFNNQIGFEINMSESLMHISDDPYNWAEIASGFNRDTRISPIHGALIASVIINNGELVEPTIVDRIADAKDRTIYRNQVTLVRHSIKPATSRALTNLMETTIRSGTCRKSFRGYKKDRVLSKLNIGGKTGTIDNRTHDARYDWFIGFAEEKDGPEKIAISVVVAHEKYIGTRASQYARLIMKEFFRDYFAKNQHKHEKPVGKS